MAAIDAAAPRFAENLCDEPQFTGYTGDGGFATHIVVDSDSAFVLDCQADPVALAPPLSGQIGWRFLKKADDGKRIALYELLQPLLHALAKGSRNSGSNVVTTSQNSPRMLSG